MLQSKVFISLGSNVGNRSTYLQQAIEKIRSLEGVNVIKLSSIMETSPIGVKDQPNYLNRVMLLSTNIPPDELLATFKEIEKNLGRKPRARWAEREIDIDIIEYEGVQIDSKGLTLPHKEMLNRLFILKGCYEVLPDYMMVHYNSTIKTLYFEGLERLKDQIVLDTGL